MYQQFSITKRSRNGTGPYTHSKRRGLPGKGTPGGSQTTPTRRAGRLSTFTVCSTLPRLWTQQQKQEDGAVRHHRGLENNEAGTMPESEHSRGQEAALLPSLLRRQLSPGLLLHGRHTPLSRRGSLQTPTCFAYIWKREQRKDQETLLKMFTNREVREESQVTRQGASF